MHHTLKTMALSGVFASTVAVVHAGRDVPPHLPGELPAEQILNGEYPFPDSPKAQVKDDFSGFAKERLTPVPPAGVHPRILISPEDLPGLRRRLKETVTGKALCAVLRARTDDALRNPKQWGSVFYDKLAVGDLDAARALVNEHKGFPPGVGHYQSYLEAIAWEAFDALIAEDTSRGKKAGTALATYAKLIQPGVEKVLAGPMGDDIWRAKLPAPPAGDWSMEQSARDALGYHIMGYGYDFAYNFMSDAERSAVRSVIAKATAGKLWMGCRLPHHFRNWNWVAVGLGQPLLALSIEGEPGYDARVYKLGVQIARDYLTYAISGNGCSTEAVGYTQFGLVWGNPFFVAATRRGDNLLVHNHHRAMVDWYIHAMEPFGGKWVSHGDGGDGGPSLETALMWKYYFPDDPKTDYLLQSVLGAAGNDLSKGKFHMFEPLVFASDPLTDATGKPVDYAAGAKLNQPLTWFDPVRSSLIARNAWSADGLMMEFECRTDSVGASHEHADRGNFTLSALGRDWAKDNFRSVESRHHNCVLIDGKGQGFWPGPGRWLGLEEKGGTLVASCDAKGAYDWMWPKQIITEDPKQFARFRFPHWDGYVSQAGMFRNDWQGYAAERDTRPSVVAHWTGFDKGDPRMWDEDSWPVRYPFNPVRRAFRSITLSRGANPFVLVVDDIQKDNRERLYEWLMQTGPDTEVVSMADTDMVLCDATVPRDASGAPKPAKGARLLLVRVLDMNDPELARDYQTRPSMRLETFERKDTLMPQTNKGALSGARSFGMDKRLVIASRSVSPDFKIMLYPYRNGEPKPVTTWNENKTRLEVETPGGKTAFRFTKTDDGRTLLTQSER